MGQVVWVVYRIRGNISEIGKSEQKIFLGEDQSHRLPALE